MEKYLFDCKHNITGHIREEWEKKYTLYDDKYNDRIGYYDGKKDQTYDAYGKLTGEGNLLSDLPYMPHKLNFPLPGLEQVSFTRYKLEKAGNVKGIGNHIQYWDDGICKVCNKKVESTCHVQGLPGMCKTCYRFFAMYSQKDTYYLERKSYYYPITIRQIQEAVEKTKAPFIAAAEAADKAAKKALFHAFIGTLDTIADSLPDARLDKNQGITEALPQVQKSVKQNTETVRTQKKRFRWYKWALIILLLYIVIEFVIPLVLFFIWYYLS